LVSASASIGSVLGVSFFGAGELERVAGPPTWRIFAGIVGSSSFELAEGDPSANRLNAMAITGTSLAVYAHVLSASLSVLDVHSDQGNCNVGMKCQ
jgi:hypothetical protein